MTGAVSFNVSDRIAPFPILRSDGRTGRDCLDELLDAHKPADLTIDFDGVDAMSFSFVDEFLGKFLTSHDFSQSNATVKLAGLGPDNLFAVEACIDRRATQVALVSDGRLRLLGEDEMLAATFDCAVRLDTFRTADLVRELAPLKAPNANNRLKRLTAVGALRKSQRTGSSRGGKEFVYEVVSADIPTSQRFSRV